MELQSKAFKMSAFSNNFHYLRGNRIKPTDDLIDRLVDG
jgi:hypothetical protein